MKNNSLLFNHLKNISRLPLFTKNKIKNLPHEHRIYNYLSGEILDRVDLSRIQSQLMLIVDKRKGQHGINEFNKFLMPHLEAALPLNVIFDISHEQSHDNPALQAVDLFCWGIRRFFEYGDGTWLSIYRDRLTLMEVDNFAGIKKDGP
jgi:hypothetical protein